MLFYFFLQKTLFTSTLVFFCFCFFYCSAWCSPYLEIFPTVHWMIVICRRARSTLGHSYSTKCSTPVKEATRSVQTGAGSVLLGLVRHGDVTHPGHPPPPPPTLCLVLEPQVALISHLSPLSYFPSLPVLHSAHFYPLIPLFLSLASISIVCALRPQANKTSSL